MKSDESIEGERQWLEPLVGPTKAEWYADACRLEYDAHHGELLWACRYRETAIELGRRLDLIRRLVLSLDEVAVSENGIAEEVWDAYAEACELLDHAIPLTSRPWADPT